MKSPDDLQLLARCPLLAGASSGDFAWVLQAGKRYEVKANQIVFWQGDMQREIYFILSGGVKATTLSRDGKELIVDVLGTGDFFGEMSSLDGKPRSLTVTTLVPCLFLVLEGAEFNDLLGRSAQVSRQLIAALVARLRQMDTLLEDVVFLDVEARLARRLLTLSTIYGAPDGDASIRITLKMSQQEFANLVGITRESVNKHFRKWEEAGWIRTESGCVVLCAPERLRSLSDDRR
jgi:CRP/FNR family transcriptional regulator, cyclic AMP receptor protein